MADYTRIQDGDLDDAATVTTIAGHGNLADYVGFGLEVSADLSTSPGTYSISDGKVFCLLETQYASGAKETVHDCLVTSHYDPRSGLELAGTGVNHIWAVLNIDTDDSPHFEATTTQSAPSDDSVRIAEVDTAATDNPVTEINRDPDGNYEGLTTEDLWVNGSITWPDGVTTDSHPLSQGDTLDNPNDYYDENATEPPGVVNRADSARRADSANTASHADFADEAGNAETIEETTLDEIFNHTESLRAQPWDPLFDEPYVNDSYEQRPEAVFDTSGFDYDRYKVRLHVENDESHSVGLGCYINDISDNVYNMINLLPREEYGERVVQKTGGNTWTVGSTGSKSHSLHEFYIALPSPIVSGGPRRRHPLFNAGIQHTSGIGSYELSGTLTKSVKGINKIEVETGGKRMAIRAQIYGQHFFPESEP